MTDDPYCTKFNRKAPAGARWNWISRNAYEAKVKQTPLDDGSFGYTYDNDKVRTNQFYWEAVGYSVPANGGGPTKKGSSTGGGNAPPPVPPSVRRVIRVSGNPAPLVLYGRFSGLVESALADGWLSRYEYGFLRRQIGAPSLRGLRNDPLDLMETLRQTRYSDGFKGPGLITNTTNANDDGWNFGNPREAGNPPIAATFQDLPGNPNAFEFYLRHCQSGEMSLNAWTTPRNLAAFTGFLTRKFNNVLSHPDLAPDDRCLLAAIMLVKTMELIAIDAPGSTLTLAIPSMPAYTLPGLTPAQRTAWDRLPKRNGELLYTPQLKNFVQGVVNGLFFTPAMAGGTPPGAPSWWTWPIFP